MWVADLCGNVAARNRDVAVTIRPSDPPATEGDPPAAEGGRPDAARSIQNSAMTTMGCYRPGREIR
jgi:hypothetical protein